MIPNRIRMALTVTEECWIKFYIWLITLIITAVSCTTIGPIRLLGQFFVIPYRMLTKGKGKSVLLTLRRRIVGEGVVLHLFLTSALDGGEL